MRNNEKNIVKLQELKTLAKSKKGFCHSPHYFNARFKYLWECKKGHMWYASWTSVKHVKTWCPTCAKEKNKVKRRKYTIKDLKQTARENHGRCLSKNYISVHHKYLWECAHGHSWEASYNSVLNNKTWCRKCSLSNRKKRVSDNVD